MSWSIGGSNILFHDKQWDLGHSDIYFTLVGVLTGHCLIGRHADGLRVKITITVEAAQR